MGVSHPGTQVATLTAAGLGSVTIAPPPTSVVWRIYQLSIGSTITALISIDARINNLPCLTANLWIPPVTAQGDPPIDVGAHSPMIISFIGPAGAVITAAYYYEEIPSGLS